MPPDNHAEELRNTSPNSTPGLNPTLNVLKMLNLKVDIPVGHASLCVAHQLGEFDVADLPDSIGSVRVPCVYRTTRSPPLVPTSARSRIRSILVTRQSFV